MPERQVMLERLIELLQQKKSSEFAKKHGVHHLPGISRKLEYFLYTQAASYLEYRNVLTLQRRLKFLVGSIWRQSQAEAIVVKRKRSMSAPVLSIAKRSCLGPKQPTNQLLQNNPPEIIRHVFSFLSGKETIRCRVLNSTAASLLPSAVTSLVLSTTQLDLGLRMAFQLKYARVEELIISRHPTKTRELLEKDCAPLEMHATNAGEAVIAAFARAVTTTGAFPELKKLSMCSVFCNTVFINAASALSTALPHWTRLRYLSLGGNSIGDDGMVQLSAGLAKCTTLKHLDLRSNFIGERGCGALFAALQQCPLIQDICLGGNILLDSSACIIDQAIRSGKLALLKYLGVEHNFIQMEGLLLILSHKLSVNMKGNVENQK